MLIVRGYRWVRRADSQRVPVGETADSERVPVGETLLVRGYLWVRLLIVRGYRWVRHTDSERVPVGETH